MDIVARHLHHTGAVIHNDQTARTHHRSGLGESIIIHGEVEQLLRDTPPGRPPGLYGLEAAALLNAAPDFKDNLPQSGAHRRLHKACVDHLPYQREHLCSFASLGTDGSELFRARVDNNRYIGPGFHIIDHRRPSPQSPFGRKDIFVPGLADIPLNRAEQGCLLTADKGAAAAHDLYVKGQLAPQNAASQIAAIPGISDSMRQILDSQVVLVTHINKPFIRPNGIGADNHPLQHGMGVPLHDAAVHKRPRIALIPVADDISWRFIGSGAGLPFETRRKTAAPPPAQAGLQHLGNDLLRSHGFDRFFQGPVAVTLQIVPDLRGVDLPDITQGQLVLLFIKIGVMMRSIVLFRSRVTIHQALDQLPLEQSLLHDLADILRLHMAIGDVVRHDLNKGALFT